MTEKIKVIDTITLQYPMFIEEFLAPANFIGDRVTSAAGTYILFQTEITTPTRTAVSRDSGWLSEQNIEDIKSLWAQSGASFDITYEDDTTENVVFDKSQQLSFTEISPGICEYFGQFTLVKI